MVAPGGPEDVALRDGDRLDARLREDRADAGVARALGRALARHHEREPAASGEDGAASPAALARRSRAHVDALQPVARALGLSSEKLDALHARQRALLEREVERFLDRHAAGRIRRLHGALHCAALAVDDAGAVRLAAPRAEAGPGDVAEDLACVAVDLTVRRRADLAERMLASYAGEAHDFGLYDVIDFYERDVACRRAAECAAEEPAAARAFALAALSAGRRPLLPPLLVATGGRVACGKSTVARAVAERIGAPRIEADRVRHALLGGTALEPPVPEAAWARGFAPDLEARVYAAMRAEATRVLRSGRPVVLDACFPSAALRAEAAALAGRFGVPFVFVACEADAAVRRERLAGRAAHEDGWHTWAEQLDGRFEPRGDSEPGTTVALDSGRPLEEGLRILEAALPTWPEGFPA